MLLMNTCGIEVLVYYVTLVNYNAKLFNIE